MTRVTIRMRDALNGRIEIKGHCETRICAAISTLTGAVLNVLGDAAQNVVYESGNVSFDVHMTDAVQLGAFEVLCTAMDMISSTFSSEVGVTVVAPDEIY